MRLRSALPVARLRGERDELEAFIQARYEEERRIANWRQSDFAIVPELRQGPLL